MVLTLSEEQIQDLMKTWEIPAANMFDSGDQILFRFFEKHPQYLQYFPRFRNIELRDLRGKALFRAHASRILNRYAVTIDCLQFPDGMDEIKEIWREVGRNHNRFKVPQQAFKKLLKLNF